MLAQHHAEPSAAQAAAHPLTRPRLVQREGGDVRAAPPPEEGAAGGAGGAAGVVRGDTRRGGRLVPPHGGTLSHLKKTHCPIFRLLHSIPGALASCTQSPQDLWCCLLPTSQLLPSLRCIQQPPCIPTPLHQEEELRNHATEGLNVTKLGLEGRIRDLEGAVEAQHRVGGTGWAGGVGGWRAVVMSPRRWFGTHQRSSCSMTCVSLSLNPAELCREHWGAGGSLS